MPTVRVSIVVKAHLQKGSDLLISNFVDVHECNGAHGPEGNLIGKVQFSQQSIEIRGRLRCKKGTPQPRQIIASESLRMQTIRTDTSYHDV